MGTFELGQIIRLGNHRLMCGDAGNPEHVAALFGDKKPDLVFTSPPYDKQRDYKQKIDCWQTLMQRVFGAMPHHERTQVLVNLGLVHRKGEWVPYWDPWIEWMRTQGWRRFGWYVWDKLEGMPGCFNGRLAPQFEFVFHLNRTLRKPNKTIPCKWAGKPFNKSTSAPNRAWAQRGAAANHIATSAFKIPSAILGITPHKFNKTGHPAVFPIALPTAIHAAYTDPGELVYDPFAGSGTSILAAEQQGRVCYAMELAPEYCQIAVDRWAKHQAKGAA